MREDIQDYIIEQQLLKVPLKEIVDGIEREFSVKMSKQNVSKFYSRLLQREAKRNSEKGLIKDCAEVYVRHKYMKQCFDVELIKDVTEYKLKKYIKENSVIVNSCYEKLKDDILNQYTDGDSVENIAENTSYKGIKTSERVILDIIEDNIKGTSVKKEILDSHEDREEKEDD